MQRTHGLDAIDLNLLRSLELLLDERSVTRAAQRAGLTQSAMSRVLARLRSQLGDPLLIREGRALVLTPRAEALRAPLKSGLMTLAAALAPPDFDPARSRRRFVLATPDLFDTLALPRLLSRLAREAPGLELTVRPAPGPDLHAALGTGVLDLAVLARPQLRDPGVLMSRTLFQDHYLCFVRPGHPALVEDGLPLDRFIALPHVLVSPAGEGAGPVDALLAERGATRHIALRLPGFLAAGAVAAETDLVLTAPAWLAHTPLGARLHACAPPLPIPGHAVALFWNPRFTHDPGHRWLRDALAGSVEPMSPITRAG